MCQGLLNGRVWYEIALYMNGTVRYVCGMDSICFCQWHLIWIMRICQNIFIIITLFCFELVFILFFSLLILIVRMIANFSSIRLAVIHVPSPQRILPRPHSRLMGCMRATGCCLWNGHINGCMMNQPEMTGRRYMRGVSDGRTNERTIECWKAEGGDEMANRHSSKFFDH